ncbi:gamma subclass chorismate mutase AroQ [Pseudonocardia xinjiangensis]|uniref:chorismate mutase n=1 Tax=Pseudonocardia xinjiangensis TaxID=75289 RepID=A0ABX1RH30_9PSEU|nr:gamma subclass chorismate mutase AroQ [Pseudonocardia xinjiangensis]NMH79695.1 gamma subclass chorismate mutase AroQ [Pseudonocardia xinjiangensis]
MSVDSSVELADFGSLVDLAVQRILVSDEVAATKFWTGTPVEDPLRERQVLAEAGRRAAQMGLDREMAVRFFRSQIDASKVVQRGMLGRWRAHPDLAPTAPPDLHAIRTRLDALTGQMLEQLRATHALRRHSSLCRTLLLDARVPVVAMHDLDGLHRRALDVAVEFVCLPA